MLATSAAPISLLQQWHTACLLTSLRKPWRQARHEQRRLNEALRGASSRLQLLQLLLCKCHLFRYAPPKTKDPLKPFTLWTLAPAGFCHWCYQLW